MLVRAEYENAIQWLSDAGLVYKVCRLSKVAMPLSFYFEKDAFKLFLLDVGLLGAMAQVPPALMLIGDNVFSEFKGAFTENYVLTQMLASRNVVADIIPRKTPLWSWISCCRSAQRFFLLKLKQRKMLSQNLSGCS